MKKITILVLASLIHVAGFASGHVASVLSSTNITCFGMCDGTATGSVSGGVGPFAFSWTGGGAVYNGVTVNSLCAATYTLTVTDSSDMSTASTTLSILQASPISISLAFTNTICAGSCVTFTPMVSGGVTPYTYTWSPMMSTQPTVVVCPTVLTSYTLTVVDANGCMNTASTIVNVDTLPDASFSYPGNVFCSSGGIISALLIYANGPFSSSMGLMLNPNTGEIDLGASTPGTYTVTHTATSASGCTSSSSIAITVTAQAVGTFTFPGSPFSQTSSSNTAPVFTGGGIVGSFTAWPAGLVMDVSTGIIDPQLSAAGIYTVTNTIAAGGGCPSVTDTNTVIIGLPANISFSIVPDSTNGMGIWTYNSSTTMASTSWDFGDGSFSTLYAPSHVYTTAGIYNVCQIISGSTFSDTLCHTINITGAAPGTCMALYDAARTTFNSNVITITDLSYGANLTYLWDFGDGNTSSAPLPSHSYSGTGPYQLCLTVDNGAGCNQTFCDSLFAVDSLGHSVMQPISIDVVNGPSSGTSVGINETTSATSVELAPNPFNETTVFTIHSMQDNQVYSFQMMDVLGKHVQEIKEIHEKQFILSRSGIKDGLYFYKVMNNEGVIGIGKMIIK